MDHSVLSINTEHYNNIPTDRTEVNAFVILVLFVARSAWIVVSVCTYDNTGTFADTLFPRLSQNHRQGEVTEGIETYTILEHRWQGYNEEPLLLLLKCFMTLMLKSL